MVNKKGNAKQSNSNILSIFTSIGGVITIVITCIGGGFAVGGYYKEIKLNEKIREIENQNYLQNIEYREKNLELREKYQKEILDLKNQIYILQAISNNYENEKNK